MQSIFGDFLNIILLCMGFLKTTLLVFYFYMLVSNFEFLRVCVFVCVCFSCSFLVSFWFLLLLVCSSCFVLVHLFYLPICVPKRVRKKARNWSGKGWEVGRIMQKISGEP